MKTSDFYYDLPKELIAQTPLKDRSSSRLLIVGKTDGSLKHGHFTDILEYLNEGDCLVLNDTRVIPARLYGVKEGTGAKIEFLLLNRKSQDEQSSYYPFALQAYTRWENSTPKSYEAHTLGTFSTYETAIYWLKYVLPYDNRIS